MGSVPLGSGPEGKERFPHQGKPTHQQGDQLGQKGSFRVYQRRAQQPVCGRKDRVRPTQVVHATALRTPD